MARTIRNLEIFGAGTHNASSGKVTVTENDLDLVVDSFNKLQGKGIVKPHLKLGHTEAQKWFGQNKGVPTLGWIDKVWRQGNKILADISNIPDALMSLIEGGRYHNVSAELYPQLEVDGTKYPWVLSAVALLGIEMPAVKDLAGLAAALFAEQFSAQVDAEVVTFDQENNMPGDKDNLPLYSQIQLDAMVAAAVQKAASEANAKFESEKQDTSKKLEVAEKRATTAEAALVKLQNDTAEKEAINIVDQAIKDGKLLPKQKDFALAFMRIEGKIKFGDSEKSSSALFQDFLNNAGKQVDLGEKGSGDNKEKTNFNTAAEEVEFKVGKAMRADTKLTYAQAFDNVLAAEPELKTRYAAATA